MPKFDLQDTNSLSDLEYQNYILQGVSRTFALTIPELPENLRDIVGNGYLLCRIADTIEDDANITIDDKKQLASQFIELCENTRLDSKDFVQSFLPRLSSTTPAAEVNLIENTARVLQLLRSFSTNQQAILARCVRTMLEGMIYFQTNASTQGLADLNEMNRYCYHVAGVVGEMLTELYCDYSETIAAQRETLLPLSVSFGQGLQMTNILKDIWVDYQRGMCWLPQDIFARYDISLNKLQEHAQTDEFSAAMQDLIAIAAGHLHNAMEYTLLIPKEEKGLRLFSLWAIGMAQLSLRKLDQHLDFTRSRPVKISRRSVKATIFLTRLMNSNNLVLKTLFDLLNRSFTVATPTKLNLKNLPVNYPL